MDTGLVSRCDARRCTYNQEQQCTAGAIRITFFSELAQCYTYTEEPDRVEHIGIEAGDVSQCDVIDCIHNVGQRCMIEYITVDLFAQTARCSKYTIKT